MPRTISDPVVLASAYHLMATALLSDYRIVEALQLLDDALVKLSDVPTRNGELEPLRAIIVAKLGATKVLSGDVDDGARLIDAAIPWLDNEDDRAEALIDRAIAHLKRNALGCAERLAREALTLAVVPRQRRNAHHIVGEICRRTGRLRESAQHLDRVARFYAEFENAQEVLSEADLCTEVNWKR